MNLATKLAEIRALSVADRLELVHGILDTIAEDDQAVELTDAQKRELDRRIANLDADPDNVLTWEQIKARVKGRR